MPTKNTITHLFVSRCALLPHSFASYLGHNSSCIVALYDISYQQSSIEYPRITLLTSKEYIYNMYIIYIPELDISSLFLFYQIFCRSYLAYSLHLEESININCGVNHLTHGPKDVSQILIALDFALWSGSPSSYDWYSSGLYSLAIFWYSKNGLANTLSFILSWQLSWWNYYSL
jgi:hypothetical protein